MQIHSNEFSKKALSGIITFMLVIICIASFELKPQNAYAVCAHQFNGSFNTTYPTCTKDGEKIGRCTKCGSVVFRQVLSATGHTWSSWTCSKKATCTTAEVQTRKCTVCSQTATRTYGKPLDHSWGQWRTTKNPTCLATGVQIRTCTRCKSKSQTRTLEATGHKFSNWTDAAPATCTTPKKQTRKCSVCPKTETRYVGTPPGHNMKVITKDATTTSTGLKTIKCINSGCNYVSSEEVLPMLGKITIPKAYISQDDFHFHADGTPQELTYQGMYYEDKYIRIRFNSNVDWTISQDNSFIKVMDKNYKSINSGYKGDNEIIIGVSSFPSTSYEDKRTGSITIKANKATKTFSITHYNYTINSLPKSEYIQQDNVKRLIKELGSNTQAIKLLKGEGLIDEIFIDQLDDIRRIAISCRKQSPTNIMIDYIIFQAEIQKNKKIIMADIYYLEGERMTIEQNGAIFTTTAKIDSTFSQLQKSLDEKHKQDEYAKHFLKYTLKTASRLVLSYFATCPALTDAFFYDEITGCLSDELWDSIISTDYCDDPLTSKAKVVSSVILPEHYALTKPKDYIKIVAKSQKGSIMESENKFKLKIIDGGGNTAYTAYIK